MAMNKKEQAQMDELRQALRLAKALRWTEEVKTDVAPPSTYSSHVSGYVYSSHGGRVEPAWTSSVSHGRGYSEPQSRISGSQRAINMYSTKLLALRALRHAVELECAKKLSDIDTQIEQELMLS
jgi:hypothetical protein